MAIQKRVVGSYQRVDYFAEVGASRLWVTGMLMADEELYEGVQ